MQTPIFGLLTKNTFDYYGEIPVVSTFTSVARFAKGALCGLWHVVSLNGKGLKQDASDVVRAVFEVVPVVNMISAYVFNYCDNWSMLYEGVRLSNKKDLPRLKEEVGVIYKNTSWLTRSLADRVTLSVYNKVIRDLEKLALLDADEL